MTSKGYGRALRLATTLLMLAAAFTQAQQGDTNITCDEATDPAPIAYGQGTTGCSILPAVDTDRFTFDGEAGDLAEVTLRSNNTNMDPRFEVRDGVGTLIADGECFNVGCTVSSRFVLPSTDTYLLTVREVEGNETGDYQVRVERILPPLPAPLLGYDAPTGDTIVPVTDMDRFTINALAGTTIRLLARSTSTNLDPTLELRDANGAVVLDGAADGAQCLNFGCGIDLTLTPASSGAHSLLIYDDLRNESGNYELGLWCVTGDCPDAPDAATLAYDAPLTESLDTPTDADFYAFSTSAGTRLLLTARSNNTNMDPTVEIRDATGALVVNGAVDGAQCSDVGCTFALEFDAVGGGDYALIIYDGGTNESGNYQLGLLCLLGDCNGNGEEDRFETPLLSHVEPRSDTVSPHIDADGYNFYGVTGTEVQINARSANTNMDPTVTVRDAGGAIVVDGATDGAQCLNVGCTFEVPLTPATSGTYTLLLSDDLFNEVGNYEVGVVCLQGDCDSDADGLPDDDFATLNYGDNVIGTISPAIDNDFYEFQGTSGDEVRITGFSSNTNMDPTIVVRDASGSVVIDGVNDGASCSGVGCSFAVTLFPTDGRHTVRVFDNGINETGNFALGLECVFSPGPDFVCDDLPPATCADNCTNVANLSQRDTDNDGFGNACDGDFDNNGVTNAVDLGLMRAAFFMQGDLPEDMNGDGVVNAIDLGLLKQEFFTPPGPSCNAPNAP